MKSRLKTLHANIEKMDLDLIQKDIEREQTKELNIRLNDENTKHDQT